MRLNKRRKIKAIKKWEVGIPLRAREHVFIKWFEKYEKVVELEQIPFAEVLATLKECGVDVSEYEKANLL